jgi:hypothetical protein
MGTPRIRNMQEYFKVHSIEEVKTASTKTKSFKVDVSLIDLRPIMVKNDNQR